MESLITLLLISIVITLTYSIINLITKQLLLFEKENNEILEYNLFNSTLINDIEKANNYTINNSNLLLYYYNGETIGYLVSNTLVCRQNSVKRDTFKIRVVNFNFKKKMNTQNDILELQLILLNDTIATNYYLKKNNAQLINKKIFDED